MAEVLFANDKLMINKGATAEIFAGLELLRAQPQHRKASLYYWQREKRTGNAEIDYVVQKGADIVPIEVKAGTRGAMQSMHMFLESHQKSVYGIRASMEFFTTINDQIYVVPLYALGNWYEGRFC